MEQASANNIESEEVYLSHVVRSIKSLLVFLISKWVYILLFGAIGACIGWAYSNFKKPVYTSACTFVLDEGGKGSSMGQYAGLASIAGIGINTGGGLFEGDNILELYKSRTMIEKTLLSFGDFGGPKKLLIDRYIEFNKLREGWNKRDDLKNISFTGNGDSFNRNQDSIMTSIVNAINKKGLTVAKLDKKLSIINVQVESKDELFAKEFTNRIVENVNSFYILTKTKKTLTNVVILQKQADSIRTVLNSSINGVASASDAVPNANPTMLTLRVPSQKKQIDVQSSLAIYSEIVKNLEAAKLSLRQETPLIQIIDKPVLPLSVEHLGKLKGAAIGFILGALIFIFMILIKRGFASLAI
ncbi:MAG: lipopolysaccharide biosynthesis protein [Mucilaginibacter sp.]|uniref:lipopolysaccharide biosynthesis protein n=1 Tax=Mucilaginibacter sp. TaxID=1882438 RepID=UPI0032637671